MQHTVFKQEWRKALPGGVYELMFSIHLNPAKIDAFLNAQKIKPTYPGFIPIEHTGLCEVNDEIFQFLNFTNGIWQKVAS
jgi:hypothetical protein